MKLIRHVVWALFAFGLGACDSDTTTDPGTGPEPTPGDTTICGTIAGLTCGKGQYCNFGVGQCGVADAQGVCEEIPEICTKELRPVCGCDGKTYNNACLAAAAGVSIDHEGDCEETPKVCGGIIGTPCDEGEYCEFEEGNCGVADRQGVCRPKPEACTRQYDPVCGCDGKTYGNACTAAAAGASIEHRGECKDTGYQPTQ